MLTIDQVAWYTVVTLRDSCLSSHLSSLRKYYPTLPVYVIDNNIGQFNIAPIAEQYNATVLVNTTLRSLTENQTLWSQHLFELYPLLSFSSDDIQILEGGFVELALDKINSSKEIVSFSTDRDPVAYMYTQKFFNDVGFNQLLLGKEDTDTDLIKRTRNHYGTLDSVGEFWRCDNDSWSSRFVMNPRLGVFGKTDVNRDLEKLGLDSGVHSNKTKI